MWFIPGLEMLAAYLILLLQPPSTIGNPMTKPRIRDTTFQPRKFSIGKQEGPTVLYHEPGTSSVLVGGADVLYQFDFNLPNMMNFSFNATSLSSCDGETSNHCKNYLTVVQKFKGDLLVCGTNAYNPTCWNWDPIHKVKSNMMTGRGFAPFVPDNNHLVLFSGNDAYSTIGKTKNNGKMPRFRRIYGKEPFLYTKDHLMENPQYVKIKLVTQEESYKDKIYIFFREDNLEQYVDTDITVSRVAQLCKEDGGGTGGQASSMWSTFLKARLQCSCPESGRFYSRLHDIFFTRCEKTKEIRVYGVFSNPWHHTAVCVYTMGDIEDVFRKSPFKGNASPYNLGTRPGECLANGTKTPSDTFKMASEHPEMLYAVLPVGNRPLFQCHELYRKIVVDQVTALDNVTYNVLLMATETGAIHKFLEINGTVVNILEMNPFRVQGPTSIHSMELDSITKRLYITSSEEVVEVPLDQCDVYQQDYQSCVMARDPYCGWANGNCMSVLGIQGRILQNIADGTAEFQLPRVEQLQSQISKQPEETAKILMVKPSSSLFLLCPVVSHHATYTWKQNGRTPHTCLMDQTSQQCIYLNNEMADKDFGIYDCISTEGGSNQTMAQYRIEYDHGNVALVSAWLVVVQVVMFLLLLH
ncbi:semaphorin-7A [Pleurodeles waltl]|uniref:semaphorin-7A n=1 Tax=Pleurodeles waltl TaxID=8319 RepID=UPI003709812C